MPSLTTLPEHTLLLFGPQIPRGVPAHLPELRRAIRSDHKLDFLARIIRDLPSLWTDEIQQYCPRLERLNGVKERLHQLKGLLENDSGDVTPELPSCNLLQAPLTVITQIADWVRLERSGSVQGFCLGFLTAAVVASARNNAELAKAAATAIRLAICIGAVVDLDEQDRAETNHDTFEYSSTWSVRWKSIKAKEHLENTLSSFSGVGLGCTPL